MIFIIIVIDKKKERERKYRLEFPIFEKKTLCKRNCMKEMENRPNRNTYRNHKMHK